LLFNLSFPITRAQSAVAPGGFLDVTTSGLVRPVLTASQVGSFMPARGRFLFPAPYGTEGIRLTNASDCGGSADCVRPVGYSFWRNINNHAGSSTMLIFMGLDRQKGGAGPSLFSYNKQTGETRNLGPLFDSSNGLSWSTGEGWYFSATQPHALYVMNGSRLQRYDVMTRALQTVFDVTTHFGANHYIWNVHSSHDDRVHSFTLRDSNTYAMLGCAAFHQDTGQYQYFPRTGEFDECQVDKSGRYLVIKENVDGVYGEDNVIVDLQSGGRQTLYDENGAAGHSDVGFGYQVAEDNFASVPGAVRVWRLGTPLNDPSQGALVFHTTSWAFGANHIAHSNANANLSIAQQFACSSNANRQNLALANEVLCYRLDGSLGVLVVAPVMTDLNASGGGDDYWKYPKGNIDPTGEYFIWTTNMGGNRLDAVMVRLPTHVLPNGPAGDTTAPTVNISSPANGGTVSGSVSVTASASDNAGVAGVQFLVNGTTLGGEDTSAPYAVSWSTTGLADGSHALTARARDTSGNVTLSAPVSVTVSNATAAPEPGPEPAPEPEPSPSPGPAPAPSVQPVQWTALQNARVTGAGLRKQGGCGGCDDSGAVSTQQIASGDGYMEFSIPDVRPMYFVGLSNGNPGTTGSEIRFALRLQSRKVEVRESGIYRAEIAASRYDVFRVAVVGGTVQYSRNGTVFYTSGLSPAYPLLVDSALYDSKAGVYNATIAAVAPSSSPPPSDDPEPGTVEQVVWTSLVNTAASGGTLTKSGGCGGCADAGAVSSQQITSGNGFVEFSVPDTAGLRFAGLSYGNPGTTGGEIAYGLRIQSGRVEVRELGAYRADAPLAAGDVLRIAVQNGVVTYLKNGTVLYTSAVAPSYPLLVDTAFYDLNTTVSNAVIGR
jgi:hypothetical protein